LAPWVDPLLAVDVGVLVGIRPVARHVERLAHAGIPPLQIDAIKTQALAGTAAWFRV